MLFHYLQYIINRKRFYYPASLTFHRLCHKKRIDDCFFCCFNRGQKKWRHRIVVQQECAGNYLSHRYKNDYIVIGNLVANESEEYRIENMFIDDHHPHYYMKMPTNVDGFLREDVRQLNYQSKSRKLDLLKAVDIILFNRSQTAVKFRGN